MGKRKVSILEQAATAVAEIAFFIEGKGMPLTAKKFVDDVFAFLKRFPLMLRTIAFVDTKDGRTWVTNALTSRKSMW